MVRRNSIDTKVNEFIPKVISERILTGQDWGIKRASLLSSLRIDSIRVDFTIGLCEENQSFRLAMALTFETLLLALVKIGTLSSNKVAIAEAKFTTHRPVSAHRNDEVW
uniref:Uncharacterized protein n=1 Tax=Vespula pensylvanica TaxID=30213 RepID=A0A834P0B4_VESPE|nr:hypothetical protein H0235_008642 [Vespula pensylvanica]